MQNRNRVVLICVLLLGLFLQGVAGAGAQDWAHKLLEFRGSRGERDRIWYYLYQPAEYDPNGSYGLVVYLHGGRPIGNGNPGANQFGVRFAKDDVQLPHPSFVLCPNCPKENEDGTPLVNWVDGHYQGNGFYAFQPEPAAGIRRTAELIDALQSQYSIDPAQIMVVGHSNGGGAVWDLFFRYPSLFSSAIPISSYTDPGESATVLLSSTRIWAFHGTVDTTVPPLGIRTLVDDVAALNQGELPPQFRYTEYPDGDHGIPRRVEAEPDLIPWMWGELF